MGLVDRLFNRSMTRDKFAQWVLKRLRASGETCQIAYDPEQFRLSKSSSHQFFLNNFYEQYLRLPKSEHEALIHSFLTTWHTSGLKSPESFADAKADLLPALRSRSYLEIGLHLLTDNFRSNAEIPSQVVAEHLAASLVYDLPQSMMTVNSELLEEWDITFYEAMEVAKDNLRQNTREFAQLGDVYAFGSGDSYDASRLLITDLMHQLEVQGDTIAMVPNRERLYVCGSEDAVGLAMLAKLVAEEVQHERNISGLAFRLVGDDWETWLPPANHPTYTDYYQLRLQSLGQTYAEQKDLLDKRHQLEGVDIFVATYSAVSNEKSGRLASYCVWSEGIDSLLPETDQVLFFRPTNPQEEMLVASGEWDHVQRVVGDLMERQDFYPERWRVREFPTEAMLNKIGKSIE